MQVQRRGEGLGAGHPLFVVGTRVAVLRHVKGEWLMGFERADLAEFEGRWVALSVRGGGSVEGEITSVGLASLRLAPVLVMIRGEAQIVDHVVLVPLDTIKAVRCFERSLAEELIAEAKKAEREAQQTAPPHRPAASWGNHI